VEGRRTDAEKQALAEEADRKMRERVEMAHKAEGMVLPPTHTHEAGGSPGDSPAHHPSRALCAKTERV
jgi:hypothetical protein